MLGIQCYNYGRGITQFTPFIDNVRMSEEFGNKDFIHTREVNNLWLYEVCFIVNIESKQLCYKCFFPGRIET